MTARVTVVGAGAIGGTVAAYLVRGGVPVEIVDKDLAHVRAIGQAGLTVEGPGETFRVEIRALQPEQITGPLDLILLAVKSQHTRAAVARLLGHLTDQSVIVSLQNGLNEPVIARMVGPERTIGAFVNWSADLLEPGRILYTGPGPFIIGELDGSVTPRIVAISDLLRHWGPVEVTDNVMGYLWTKQGYLPAMVAQSIADADGIEIAERYRELMVDLLAEGLEVGRSEGVRLQGYSGIEPDLYVARNCRDTAAISAALDRMLEYKRLHQKPRTGIWRDLAVRQRPTEAAGEVAELIETGESHGLGMPLTRLTLSLLRDIEEGRRPLDWDNLEVLEAARRAQVSAGSR